MALNILYEDNHLLVVEKPIGMLTQADCTHNADLLTLLKLYLKDKYQKPGHVYLGLVHRLDRMTGGVMVFAKTSKAASRLTMQIQDKRWTKKYYAVVNGILPPKGHLENYLYKDEKEIKSYVGNAKNGKLAILDYQTIGYHQNTSLVDVSLQTGRHHQIRVQFSNIGHPLVGDVLYGSKQKQNLMLFAYALSFEHPISKERLNFQIMPHDRNWEAYYENFEKKK